MENGHMEEQNIDDDNALRLLLVIIIIIIKALITRNLLLRFVSIQLAFSKI